MTPEREDLAQILNKEGAYCGTCEYEGGMGSCSNCQECLTRYADVILAAGYRKEPQTMTPDQAELLRDLFMKARSTTRVAQHSGTPKAYAADDAAVEAFNTALKEAMKR